MSPRNFQWPRDEGKWTKIIIPSGTVDPSQSTIIQIPDDLQHTELIIARNPDPGPQLKPCPAKTPPKTNVRPHFASSEADRFDDYSYSGSPGPQPQPQPRQKILEQQVIYKPTNGSPCPTNAQFQQREPMSPSPPPVQSTRGGRKQQELISSPPPPQQGGKGDDDIMLKLTTAKEEEMINLEKECDRERARLLVMPVNKKMRLMEQMEYIETGVVRKDLKSFQETRRKLVFDLQSILVTLPNVKRKIKNE